MRVHEGLRALNKKAVEIDVAAREQRIVAALAGNACCGFGRLDCFEIVRVQRVALLFQPFNHTFSVGGAGRLSDLWPALGEPLHFLQLHAVPRRISDHGIKPASDRIEM